MVTDAPKYLPPHEQRTVTTYDANSVSVKRAIFPALLQVRQNFLQAGCSSHHPANSIKAL